MIFASGGIVENSKKQILFIHRKGKWDLPKGKAEKNETIRETALREVTEETGIKRLRIRKFYTNTFHLVRNNGLYFLKETSWFLMYSAITSSVTLPLLTAKYPLAHRCFPQNSFCNFLFDCKSLRALTPFKRCINFDTLSFGGIETSKCT